MTHCLALPGSLCYQEFASGGSLVKHMQQFEGGKLPEKEAQRVFQQMAHALEYCHRRWGQRAKTNMYACT